jgi:hypothetical protein
MSRDRTTVEELAPEELAGVPEHLEDADDETAVVAKAWGPLRFARMTGSSLAARDAAPWITDFLNAAYYRRPVDERDLDDLRLAFAVLTTFWLRKEPQRRLRITDLPAFHRGFGTHRFATERSGRGVLSREELLEGASRLLGDWFPEAYADDARRGWGIAFPTADERAAYDPARRMALARLGRLSPESAPPERQTWHTYPAVEMPSATSVVAALTRPETWPDYASEIGRFTPLRAGGLSGQTFEIEVAAGTASGRPIFTRGYVTITRLVTREDRGALEAYVAELNDGLARFGREEPPAVPPGADPVLAFDLTTHEGHFMGRARNRLVLYERDGAAYLRAAGTWDPMPWHLDQAYRRIGEQAQHAFWGAERAQESMLQQIALAVA